MMYQTHFTKAKEKLNYRQKEAVETIEGAVMVLAGPGTGKTEVLALRIGQILTQTDMQVSNILCLTFSNAGVQSMQKRLQDLLGPAGEQIEVHTYHSFANQILQHYKDQDLLTENGLLTDVQRFMIAEKLLSNQRLAGKYFDIKPAKKHRVNSLTKLFGLFKRNNFTVSDIKTAAEKSIQDIIPFQQEFIKKNNELNSKGLKLINDITEFVSAINPMYEAYQKIVKEHNKYEYDDMLHEAIKVLRQNRELFQTYQEMYQYILVDEFQDTNRKQLNLLELMLSNIEQPNIFIVGDDDQCIYKFQGANQENFNWLKEKLPNIKTIVLDTNYRSTELLLKASFDVISENKERHELKTNPLKSGRNIIIDENAPIVKWYQSEEEEAFGIATDLKKLLNTPNYTGTIAVLYRKNGEAQSIIKWLNYYHISYSINQSKGNLLESPFGKRIYYITQFLRVIHSRKDLATTYFCNLLMELGYAEPMLESFLLNHKTYGKGKIYIDWISENHQNENFAVIYKVYADLMRLSESPDEKLDSDFTTRITKLAQLHLEKDTAIEAAWDEFIKKFIRSDIAKTPISLYNILWYHKICQISISFENRSPVQSAVILSTFHASKGLEYDSVFIKSCHNKNWEDSRVPWNSINVPKVLNEFIKQDSDEMEDIRRVLYVGLTRAKYNLTISYSTDETKRFPLKASELLSPLFKNNSVMIEQVAKLHLPEINIGKYKIQADNQELKNLIQEKIDAFSISASSTHNWLKCQNKFFFVNICKIPDEGNEAMSFGSLVHAVLEAIAKNIQIQKEVKRIGELVEQVAVKFTAEFHPLHKNAYKLAANLVVTDYLKQFPITREPDDIEAFLNYCLPNGVNINGRLDRVEIAGKTVKIIDYKTGNNIAKTESFQSEEEPGSSYWRQGMIYNYLINGKYGDDFAIDFTFHYVEEKNKENCINYFTYEQNTKFECWLLNMWNLVQHKSFNSICENDDCIYCQSKISKQ